MAFEDLKERLQDDFKNLVERVQESSSYIQLKERYENLSPSAQKITLAGIALLAVYMIFSIPLGYFSTSSESIAEFEEKRQLIRDLHKVSRESKEVADIPVPPDVNSLKARIDGQIQSAQLLPEQIQGSEIVSDPVRIIPEGLVQGVVRVSLQQLNLRQIVDLGYQFQAINPSVKMTDLRIEANAKDPRYFNVVYKLAVLAVPEKVEEAPEPTPPPRGRRK